MVLIALVWVYANCAMIPGYLGVVGTWGYNCLSGTRVGSIPIHKIFICISGRPLVMLYRAYCLQ